MQMLLRFLIGGAVISCFALFADLLRPKSFAGLFGAAPSVALATLGLTIAHEGSKYAAVEARSMALGAVAFCVYAYVVGQVLLRSRMKALAATIALLPVWGVAAFGLRLLLIR